MTDSQKIEIDQIQATDTKKLTGNKEIIAYLVEKFPFCFILNGETRPLKIGLFQDLIEALKDDPLVSRTQLRQALHQYTSSWRYLHSCKEGAVRVDLYGDDVGILEMEHVAHAAQQLMKSKEKYAEKRKAEIAAKKTQQKHHVRKQNIRKPKVESRAVDFSSLSEGSVVRIKVGERLKKANVLKISKDIARIELENGLVMNVTADRLFI